MDENKYFIIIYFYNGVIRAYFNLIDKDNIDENKIYSHVYNLCKKNVDAIIDYFSKNKKYIQIFRSNSDNLLPLNDDRLLPYCNSTILAAMGIINFDKPIFFKYIEELPVKNSYFEINLQKPLLCCILQQKKLHAIYKLIGETKQFSNFNFDDNLYKYAIIYHTDVIGYIEGVLHKSEEFIKIQCFILPKFRKNNIAKFAHQLLFSILKLSNIESKKYVCYILEHNIAAINLYKSLGFKKTEQIQTINGLKYKIYQKIDTAAFDTAASIDTTALIDTAAAFDTAASIDAPKDDFPYRRNYMPPFLTMYNNLKTMPDISNDISNDKYLFTIDRSFPDDYEMADSIIDHFVEDIRIHCAERKEKTPYVIWQENKEHFLLKSSNKKKLRELVYKSARGCNLFNVALGIQLFKYFKATSLLDCTAGWGDRLIAASIAGVKFYRGWDTNIKLQSVYKKIYNDIFKLENKDNYQFQMDWRIYCGPFEKSKLFEHDRYDGQNLYKKFDVAFLSPPFYDKELYEGNLTSTTTYKNINEWYSHFYKPMFKRAAMAVKPGGHILAYIPDGRMRHEANSVLEMEKFVYLGSVAFRTIVEGKNPQVRDTFVWRLNLVDDNDVANDAANDVANDADNDAIEQFLPIKSISSAKFKLGQTFTILSNNQKITSEEKFKHLQLNNPELKIMEIPHNVKKTIMINILIYKIAAIIIKYYLANANLKIINIEELKYVKMVDYINHIVEHICEVKLVQKNMAMVVCIFSIDSDDVAWITNIYENTKYVCQIHEEMILNQIKPFKIQYNSNEFDKHINFKHIDSSVSSDVKSLSIYLSKKNIGVVNIEKNAYGFEISALVKPTYRKKIYINTILIIIHEFVNYYHEKFNELTFIETDNSTFIKCCKLLGLKDITIFGHESSKIFKLSL